MSRNAARLFVSLSCLLLACAGSDTTTGRPVLLHTAVQADAELAGPFPTETGWTVQLNRAELSIGALYYFDGEPAFVLRQQRPLWQRLARALGPSIAHAHPGHYLAGMALGQVITPQAADLFAGRVVLPDGNGITGLYRSARLTLAAPTNEPARSQLESQVAVVEGVATKGEQTVYFKLSASFGDVARSVSQGQVDGCAFDETEVEEDGTVTLTVKPHVWFNLVDFTGVAQGTATAPTEIAAGETPQIAFALGLVQLSAYHFFYGP
ncbi:MAG: hypothetical protein RLZZ450_6637 [Pseudomonadota bacterium]